MSIEKFEQAVLAKDVQGALLALHSVDNPNMVFESLMGETPLSYAIRFERYDLVEPLLKLGVDPNLSGINGWWSPLQHAVHSRSMETYNLLIEAGASVTKVAYLKMPLLFLAVWNRDVEFCQLLIDAGVDVNYMDTHGYTAIKYAAGRGHIGVWETLLKAGADIDAVSDSILHFAAGSGRLDICDSLIKHGIDVNTKGSSGHTPLHSAAVNDQPEVCKFLRDAGADLTAQTVKGYTPSDLAKQRAYKGVTDVLK